MLHSSLEPILSARRPSLDILQQYFLAQLDELSHVSDRDFALGYKAFVGCAEQAFCIEEEWMEALDLPSLQDHREQHACALGALHHVHSRVMGGDVVIGREVIRRLLPRWFSIHAKTMDDVLANAMREASR